ncbi:hypothetical protein [Bradyrhizobium yuanmingense]|uniref:hypothetical protein n=1 Tax=Bradyrhizobium yuanmingense TaxID=108015 RepID=UPI0023B96560|nr:hypothetical protein [Bradyrhizobium yuanmingense]MDF0492273.1 hypothetical protein [Bradyrhizobium yuanmingense]
MSEKHMIGVATLAALCFTISAPASAQPSVIPPSLKNLPIKQICASSNLRYMLARSIIDSYAISPKMLDWNDDGVIEARRLVTQVICDGGKLTAAQEAKCYGDKPQMGPAGPSRSQDNSAQFAMVTDVSTMFRSALSTDSNLSLGDEKASIRFRKVRAVTEPDIKRQPILGAKDGFSTAAEVFSDDPIFYEVSCVIAPEKAGSAATQGLRPTKSSSTPSPASPLAVDASRAVAAQAVIDRFRIRGKTEDLWIGRDQDGFAGLSGATFALNRDEIAAKQNFDMHLVLGYAFRALQHRDVVLDAIPYLKYDRDYIDGVKPTSVNNVNNIGGGLQSRLTFPVFDNFYSALIFQPQYIESLRNGAQIVSVRLAAEPQPLVPYLGFVAETPLPNLWASAYARGATNYYEVTRDANDRSLTSGKNFWHAGGQVGGVLMFKDGTFTGLSFPIDYTYLYGLSGPYKSVELLQVAANYTLPRTKYITVGLSYTSGRNLDTFEMQKLYKASLGIKY